LADAIIDCRGLKCPLPVLRLEKQLAAARPGAQFVMLATDPVARVDIPLHCTQNGHACTLHAAGDELRFTIVKGGAPAP